MHLVQDSRQNIFIIRSMLVRPLSSVCANFLFFIFFALIVAVLAINADSLCSS